MEQNENTLSVLKIAPGQHPQQVEMSKKKLSKLLALYLPYVVIGLLATNLGEAWRLAVGKELGDKIVSLMDTMHILDEIIDKMVREIFSRLRGIPKEQLIISRYAKETAERKNHLQALQAERDKAEKDLLALKAEILAVIKGESAFPKDTLAEMIAAQEKKHTELVSLCEEASAELDKNAELMANVSQLYEELISYADLYDSASFESKKMIVSQLVRRIDVYRGYQIHVDFNFDLAQYLENSDELAC